MEQLHQFVALWMSIQGLHVDEHAKDDIVWKHTANGQYSMASAHAVQFLGIIDSFGAHDWKALLSFFASLAIQDRIWTADRLAKRG